MAGLRLETCGSPLSVGNDDAGVGNNGNAVPGEEYGMGEA
jgi:hypothetical protein